MGNFGKVCIATFVVLLLLSCTTSGWRSHRVNYQDFEEPWYLNEPRRKTLTENKHQWHHNARYIDDDIGHKSTGTHSLNSEDIYKQRKGKRSRMSHGNDVWKDLKNAHHRQLGWNHEGKGILTLQEHPVYRSHRKEFQDESTFEKCGIRLTSGRRKDISSNSRYYLNLRKRIVGGSEAVANSWPWQAHIRCKTDKIDVQCSGTLISKRWLITSAQCIASNNPKDYTVRLGEHDLLKLSGKESFRIVSKVIVPPVYDHTTLVNDIALVELKKDAPINSHINYACLPTHGSYVKPGTTCYMTGWGRQKASSGFKVATKLQQLKLAVVNEDDCGKALKKILLLSQLCASSSDWRGGCKFDEGSPLVCYDTSKHQWVLQGLFSYSGSSCNATETRYNVFTRISPFVSAIKATVVEKQPPKPTQTSGPTSSTPVPTSGTSTTPSTVKLSTKETSTLTVTTTEVVPPIPTSSSSPPVVTAEITTKASTIKANTLTSLSTVGSRTTPRPQKIKPAHLSIHLRSEGCDDITKTDTCGRSYIIVNGIDYSQHKQGHNVVIVDYQSGKVENSSAFDTSSKLEEALKLLNFLKALELRKVLLISVQGDGSKYEGVLQRELVKFGATLPGEISYRSSFCLLGYSGPEQVSWISEISMPRYKGPSELTQDIPLPNAKKVVRIRARSESCGKTGEAPSCGKSYVWIDGIDHSKHVDGHNVVILDFDKGVVLQTLGYSGQNMHDAFLLKKKLDEMPFRRIIVVVMQGDASGYHATVRQSLGRYGASSVIELTSYSTYAFIGYSGPERVSWTTEMWKPQDLGPTDVSVYVRKGLYKCGLQYFPPVQGSTFIVGGTISREAAWPWLGAIVDGNGKFICGSSLVHRQWVVTAAHCLLLLKTRPGPHKIVLGDSSYANPDALNLKITKIVEHPMYNLATHSNDVTLLKLEKEAPVTESIRLICLDEHEQFKTGKLCSVIGWGKTVEDGASSPVLRHTTIPLVSRTVCNQDRSYRGLVLSNMLCAGFEQGGKDACQGDSGGPLACQNRDGYWFLTGVVSWGHGCAKPHKYGVYVKVSSVAQWIKETISQ